jgi:threonine/homoserine/homoserine lactone efflux protein
MGPMTLTGLLMFTGIYVAAVATPGPGIAAVLARALGHGLAGLPFFIAGFVLGDLTLMLLAVTGLAVLVNAFAGVLFAIKLAGAAYLLYLAWKLWNASVSEPGAPAGTSGQPDSPGRLFLTTYSLTVGNPKAIVFFMAVLPTVVDLSTITPPIVAELAALIVLTMPVVLGAYAFAADRARRLFKDARSVRILNRSTAVIMAGAAAAVARA